MTGPAGLPAAVAVLSLDLGGTQIRAAAVTSNGECLGRLAVATPDAVGEEAVFAASAELLRRVAAGLTPENRDRLGAIGISAMGPVDPWRGTIVDPPNVPALRNAPLADELEKRIGLPAYLDKDTNVAAMAEHWLGAAQGCGDFMYVTVSTGLGGSIWTGGRLVLGPDGTAGEIGHTSLMLEGGPRCGCGGYGHLEAIASGSGLARAATASLGDGESAFLADRARVQPLTGRDVAEGELTGDATCTRLMERARRAFAVACVGWVDGFNPGLIVVGGTLAEKQGERWLQPAREEVAATAFHKPAARVRIVAAQLGDDVGLVGAWPLVAARHGVPEWRERRRLG